MNHKQKDIHETAQRILFHVLQNTKKDDSQDLSECVAYEIIFLTELMNNTDESNRTIANEILKLHSFPGAVNEYVLKYFSGS